MTRHLRIAAALSCLATTGALGSELVVFAAASLAGAFEEIAVTFEKAHPGDEVQLVYAGSQQLAFQIREGAPADVFAAADRRWMEHLREQNHLAGPPEIFARNRLVVIVPAANPGGILNLGDLGGDGAQLVVADAAVPLGAYTRTALTQLAGLPELGPHYPARVLANVVSFEENAAAVVGKIILGEADAGVVYRSDVSTIRERSVEQIEIPEDCNPIAEYPIARVAREQPAPLADAFIAWVLAPGGQQILARYGFLSGSERAAETPPR